MTLLLNPKLEYQLESVRELLFGMEPVGVPSETVYGLAGIATSQKALARIFELKARPKFDPLIVHLAPEWDVDSWVEEIHPTHQALMSAFWPGPLTLLFRKSTLIPDLCTAGSSWVALRKPRHPVFQKILQKIGLPLAAPSANRFGGVSPTRCEDVIAELGAFGLRAVVDGGVCELGLESTVVKVHDDHSLEIVRPGSLSIDQIKGVTGARVSVRAAGTGAITDSPGQLKSHYAPSVPLFFVESEEENIPADFTRRLGDVASLGLLSVFPLGANSPWNSLASSVKTCRVLSSRSSDVEAAACLFSMLRNLEKDGVAAYVVVAPAGQEGLLLAIKDRLRRAASL